ncbi:MAG: hypothetical protein ACXWLX_00495 [Rhizomicrobium sp.]
MEPSPYSADHGSRWHYGLSAVLGVAITATLLAAILPLAYQYRDPDAASYIEAARNLLAGKGLSVSAGLDKLPSALEPLSLWPPGYPLFIAFAAKLLGADPAWIAPKIDWLCWALLPCALSFAFRPILRNWSIHAISALVMIAPGAIWLAWQPMSDVPFLLLTILAFGALFRASGQKGNSGLLLVSGVLCGIAYTVRNVGIAIFPAVIVSFGLLALLRILRPATAIRQLLWWAVGAALIVTPLVTYNLVLFGHLQPYHMAASTLGLNINARYFLAALLTDITANREIIYANFWNNKVLAAIVAAPLALAVIRRKSLLALWRGLSFTAKNAVISLGAYLIFGTAVVVIARSRYEWGELITDRHFLQYDWIIWAMVALLVENGGRISKGTIALASAVAMLLVGLRISLASQEVALARLESAPAFTATGPIGLSQIKTPNPADSYKRVMRLTIARDHELIRAIATLPADVSLFSNYNDILIENDNRPTYRIMLDEDCGTPERLLTSDTRLSKMKAVMILFPDPQILKSGCWESLEQSPQKQRLLSVTRNYLVTLTNGKAKDQPAAR